MNGVFVMIKDTRKGCFGEVVGVFTSLDLAKAEGFRLWGDDEAEWTQEADGSVYLSDEDRSLTISLHEVKSA